MFVLLGNMVRENPLEFYTALVATAGIVFWFIDRRATKAALKATGEALAASLHLERRKAEAQAQRSFTEPQLHCETSRTAWKEQEWRNGMMLRPSSLSLFHREQGEAREILAIERQGHDMLQKLLASAPKGGDPDFEQLETYLVQAEQTVRGIMWLKGQVPMPGRFSG